ncbi:hypothetical protein Taro_038740 [Colocasia esculenta]|uniref:Uncharacterized protein n=1 Tax=Colocasia esculenta TaxID=4460 RepID=A0A843WN31_COLES|nr:hypothetical protein [Colocasia esculenta]
MVKSRFWPQQSGRDAQRCRVKILGFENVKKMKLSLILSSFSLLSTTLASSPQSPEFQQCSKGESDGDYHTHEDGDEQE